MRILYDYQRFDDQITGGISRYHADLYKGCLLNGIDATIAIKYSNNLYLKEQGMNLLSTFSEDSRFLGGKHFVGRDLLLKVARRTGFEPKSSRYFNALYCRKLLKEGKYDLFHPTYYDDIYSDINIKSPIVVTIHDMIYEDFPHFFRNLSIIANKTSWIKRSQGIITISNYTKERILRYYKNIPEDKISVIYHGIDLSGLNVPNFQNSHEEYILYVGDRGGYKDFFTLLKALKTILKKHIQLYCVGRPFDEQEQSYIDFLGLASYVRNVGRISDDELVKLYQNAQAFVSTSLSEGFGLPLLECMKYATPMILSDIPVYREVADDSAVYFKASDEYSLAESITEVVGNSNLQQQLVAKGRNRLTLFDKQNMIKNTINVYNTL